MLRVLLGPVHTSGFSVYSPCRQLGGTMLWARSWAL